LSKWTRRLLSLLVLVGLAAAAGVYLHLRNKEMKQTHIPEEFRKILEEESPAVQRIQELARARRKLRTDPDEGIRLLRQFVQAHPGTPDECEARLALAGALVERDDAKAALAELAAVIAAPKAGKCAPRAHLERARLLMASDEAAARRDLEWVFRDVQHPDLQNRARLELGLLDIKNGEFLRAIDRLGPLAQINAPEKPGALQGIREAVLGQIKHLADGGDHDAVLDWGNKTIAKFPDLAGVHHAIRYRQVLALRQVGKLREARTVLERLRRDVPAEVLGPEIDCEGELQRLAAAEEAQGILRTPQAFLKAKSAGKETRAHFAGDVAADTTWDAKHSPLVLTGVVTVKAGATLTIEPGVAVQFLQGARLVVEGGLLARGTAEEPVRFTSAVTAAPSSFDGDGIQFVDSSADDRCRLEHCIVEYQRVGVACAAAAPLIRRCTFSRNGTAGLHATEGAQPRVEELCRFEKNDGAAIRAEESDLAVRRCLILSNGGRGIHLTGKCAGAIEGNRIQGNGGEGIFCDNLAAPAIRGNEIASNQGDGIACNRLSQPTIDGNAIRENGGTGIRCLRGSAATITGNLIEGNRDHPITLEKSDGLIKGNQVLRNRPYGIHCASSASPRIEGNWIEGNGASGIICGEASSPVITGNTILGQKRAITNAAGSPVQATGNYFGEVSDDDLAGLIFDKTNQSALGEVVWRPRLTKPPARPPQPQLDLPPLP